MDLTIAGLACFVLRVIADIGEAPDYGAFLLASNEELLDDFTNDAFLLSFGGEVPDDSTNFYTESFDDPLQSSTAGLIASSQPECTSSNDNPNNLFFSRLRPRIDACLPSLTPPRAPLKIYDSNSILNQLAPPVILPMNSGAEKNDRTELDRLLELPGFTRDTDPVEQDDACPKELVGESQTPVCSSGENGRDHIQLPGEDVYTLYNVRHCTSQKIKLAVMLHFINQWMKLLIHSCRVSACPMQGATKTLVLCRRFSRGKVRSYLIYSIPCAKPTD